MGKWQVLFLPKLLDDSCYFSEERFRVGSVPVKSGRNIASGQRFNWQIGDVYRLRLFEGTKGRGGGALLVGAATMSVGPKAVRRVEGLWATALRFPIREG